MFDGFQSEQLIGGDLQGFGEIDEHSAGRLHVVRLVVRDHAIGHADGVAQFFLGHAPGHPDGPEALPEAFDGPLFHDGRAPSISRCTISCEGESLVSKIAVTCGFGCRLAPCRHGFAF